MGIIQNVINSLIKNKRERERERERKSEREKNERYLLDILN